MCVFYVLVLKHPPNHGDKLWQAIFCRLCFVFSFRFLVVVLFFFAVFFWAKISTFLCHKKVGVDFFRIPCPVRFRFLGVSFVRIFFKAGWLYQKIWLLKHERHSHTLNGVHIWQMCVSVCVNDFSRAGYSNDKAAICSRMMDIKFQLKKKKPFLPLIFLNAWPPYLSFNERELHLQLHCYWFCICSCMLSLTSQVCR